jgi:hypothetical protein
MAIEHHDLPEIAIQDDDNARNSDKEERKDLTAAYFDAIVPPLTFSKDDKATIGLARRMKKWFRGLLGGN